MQAAWALVATPAQAQSEASAALSLLPVASVVGTASVGAAASGAALALPVALSAAGAALTVKTVEASAVWHGVPCSNGLRMVHRSVSKSRGRGAVASAHGVGTVVACSVIGTGAVLSVAGEVLAFVPNALGQALLHNERL